MASVYRVTMGGSVGELSGGIVPTYYVEAENAAQAAQVAEQWAEAQKHPDRLVRMLTLLGELIRATVQIKGAP